MSKLVAGREMDALVAKHVFNLELTPNGCSCGYIKNEPAIKGCQRIPNYSTSIADAWLVVEKLIENGWIYYRVTGYVKDSIAYHTCLFEGAGQEQPMFRSEGDTAPHAICLAALKACGVSDE
jgi:hypothetical protein